MTAETHALTLPASAPTLRMSRETLRGSLLWLTAVAGAFVFIEPSPYEIVSLLAIVVFAVTGLSLRPSLMPLVLLLTFYNIGFSVAVLQVLHQSKPLIWVLVSWYMAATAVFFAAALTTNTAQRLELIARGCLAAAMIASLVGILAYFRMLPLSDLFLKFDRARGTFNDPNVLGAFLVFPALLALQRMITGRRWRAVGAALVLAILLMALLLSFSRAAWGQFAGSAALLMALMIITGRSDSERMRIMAIGALGVAMLALFVAALLSLDQVAALFKERATLDQYHDTAHFGRFSRYVLGSLLVLDHPFGLGPLQFATIFTEDPHNSYLNAFMSGGWISGICYPVLVLVTLALGWRFVPVRTPWQPTYLAVFCAYTGLAVESAIIDTEHWRHFYLLLGVLWGLIAASRTYTAGGAAGGPAPLRAKARQRTAWP